MERPGDGGPLDDTARGQPFSGNPAFQILATTTDPEKQKAKMGKGNGKETDNAKTIAGERYPQR